MVWGFVTPDKYLIKGVRKVKYMSLRYFYELCTSGVFVTNYRMTLDYHKRKGAFCHQISTLENIPKVN